MIKKLAAYIGIVFSALLFTSSIAYAVGITVPSAPGSGYCLISTTTGNYIASTTVCGSSGGGGGTNFFSNSGATTSLTTGTVLFAPTITASTSTLPNINSVFYVPANFATQGCMGSSTATTFQACVYAIYSSQAGIASGTTIWVTNNVPRSSFTGPLAFNINQLIPSLKCSSGVTIGYSGTGTAINFNFGNPIGHLTSDDSGCIFMGQPTLIVAGQTNTATTTGIAFGGNLGAVGINWHDNSINGFGTDISIGSNAYLDTFANDAFSGGNGGQIATGSLVMIYPASNSGERNVFTNDSFTDPGNSSSTNAFYISNGATASNFITNTSIDDAQIHVGASDGQVVLNQNHIENPDSGQYGPYIPIQGVSSDRSTMITLIGNVFANDATTNGFTMSLIQHGGQLYAAGNSLQNYAGGTVATFSDHSLDNGVESETICQTQAQGGTLTSIIGGNGNLPYTLGTGASCATDAANSYPIGMNANSSNVNDIYSGSTNVATFDHNGNWVLGVNSTTGSLIVNGPVTDTGPATSSFKFASSSNISINTLVDSTGSTGATGSVLQTTGSAIQWVATSSLGITGSGTGSTSNLTASTGISIAANLISNIGYGNQVFNVMSYGATGNGVTNDGPAIQSAVNAAVSAGGGTIYFPVGIYLDNNPFVLATSTGLWSQIQFPIYNLSTQKEITLKFLGAVPPAPNINWTTDQQPLSTTGAIIESTLVGTTSASSTIMGPSAPVGATWGFDALNINLQDLTFRTYNNPTISALNFSQTGQVTLSNLLVDTGTILPNISQPTHNSSGIILPGINNWAVSNIYNTDVVGYTNDYTFSEHTDMDSVRAWDCINGYSVQSASHSINLTRALTTACQVGINAASSTQGAAITIENYSVEHTNISGQSWASTTYDIYDPNNALNGTMSYDVVISNIGRSGNLLQLGGERMTYTNLNTQTITMGIQTGDKIQYYNDDTGGPTDGNAIGIGVLSGQLYEYLYPAAGQRFAFDSKSPALSGYAELMSILSTGNVGIGSTSPTYQLGVSGNIQATGTVIASCFSTSTPGTNCITGGGGGGGTNYFTNSGATTTLTTGSNLQVGSIDATSTTQFSTISNNLLLGYTGLTGYTPTEGLSFYDNGNSGTTVGNSNISFAWNAAPTRYFNRITNNYTGSGIVCAMNFEITQNTVNSSSTPLCLTGEGDAVAQNYIVANAGPNQAQANNAEVYLAGYPSLGGEYGGMWVGTTPTIGTTNYAFIAGGGSTFFNATSTAGDLEFRNANSTDFSVDQKGIAYGIGTNVLPTIPFNIASSTGGNASMLNVQNNGNVGIGSTTPGVALAVVGTTTSSGFRDTSYSSAFAAFDPAGNLIATTTPSGGGGTNYLTNSGGANTFLNTGTNLQAPTFQGTSTTGNNIFLANTIIGTSTAPAAMLYVQGLFGTTIPVFNVASTTNAAGATTSILTATANERVGIASTSPSQTLGVGGNAQISGDTNIVSTLSIGPNNFNTYPLSVTKTASGVQTLGYFQNLDGAANDGVQICFDNRASLGDISVGSCLESLRTNAVNSGDSDLILQTSAGTTMNKVGIFKSNGDFGVGTTTPTAMMEAQAATNTNPFIIASSSGASLLNVLPNGNVDVSTNSFQFIPGGQPLLEMGANNVIVALQNGNTTQLCYNGSPCLIAGNGQNVQINSNAYFPNNGLFGLATSTPANVLSVGSTTNTSLNVFSVSTKGSIETGGGTPVASCASTCTLSAHSNDQSGTIQLSGVQTSVTLTFFTPKEWTPNCVVSDNVTAGNYDASSTPTAVVFSTSVSLGTASITYFCPE